MAKVSKKVFSKLLTASEYQKMDKAELLAVIEELKAKLKLVSKSLRSIKSEVKEGGKVVASKKITLKAKNTTSKKATKKTATKGKQTKSNSVKVKSPLKKKVSVKKTNLKRKLVPVI